MAKKVNTFGDDWFDLSKYDKVKDFDIHDWHYQLSQRFFIQKHPWVSNKELYNIVSEYIELIKDEPILDYEKPEIGSLTVRDARYVDLYFASWENKSLKDIFGIPAKKMFKEEGKTPVVSQYNFGEAGLGIALLTIDRGARDKQLINDFKEWLKNHRTVTKYTAKARIFNSKDFERWSDNKLLPYLDLTLIANVEGEELTQEKLGELLFPKEFDAGLIDRIRQTVKPQAESLISNETLAALSCQSRGERHKK